MNAVGLKSPASRLFAQSFCFLFFFQAQINENIKAPRHWPLWGELPGNWWISRTEGQLRGKCLHFIVIMTHFSCHVFVGIRDQFLRGQHVVRVLFAGELHRWDVQSTGLCILRYLFNDKHHDPFAYFTIWIYSIALIYTHDSIVRRYTFAIWNYISNWKLYDAISLLLTN